MTSKYEHWTDGLRINETFVKFLMKGAPREVTNKLAYKVYARHCAERTTFMKFKDGSVHYVNSVKDPFLQMNVRNQLCKLEHLKRLKRVKPGLYVWS